MSNPFHYPKVKIENSWRSIILLGSNTSCYKFALGKTLLEMGYKKVKNVGGIRDWITAGGPTET